MTPDLLNAPAARSWRDIPQPVKPRSMSAGGRWRLGLSVGRALGATVVLGGLAWGSWQVWRALHVESAQLPEVAKSVPVKRVELVTANGGVLDQPWLTRTLALPKGVALMELDLERLRGRLLADGQVMTATLIRRFPDALVAQISERTPVARLNVRTGGGDQTYLVARDGVVYSGSNYEPQMLATLPWLAGLVLKPQGASFRPIPQMAAVADLLARAQYEATHLYLDWQSVSLERLELDREIEVTTKDGSRMVFSTKSDFFPQLAKLDNILEQLRDARRFPAAKGSRVRIDLSLGREVPVQIESLASAAGAASSTFHLLPPSASKNPRDL